MFGFNKIIPNQIQITLLWIIEKDLFIFQLL